jgi:DNA mismatch repair ATPase MutL
VRVQDFLKTIPVRRQTAVKSASRTLSDIKQLLQSYAFARPNIRFCLKILKAKNEKYNWTYGPKPGSTTLLNATAGIVGQEVATNCEARLWTSGDEEDAIKAYRIDAVIAKEDGGRVTNRNGKYALTMNQIPSRLGAKATSFPLTGAQYLAHEVCSKTS